MLCYMSLQVEGEKSLLQSGNKKSDTLVTRYRQGFHLPDMISPRKAEIHKVEDEPASLEFPIQVCTGDMVVTELGDSEQLVTYNLATCVGVGLLLQRGDSRYLSLGHFAFPTNEAFGNFYDFLQREGFTIKDIAVNAPLSLFKNSARNTVSHIRRALADTVRSSAGMIDLYPRLNLREPYEVGGIQVTQAGFTFFNGIAQGVDVTYQSKDEVQWSG